MKTSSTPRTLVTITFAVWAVIGFLIGALSRDPTVVLFPLYGLCPFEMASGEAGYHPMMLYIWGIPAGAVFIALALIGFLRNNKPAALAFMVLFLLSTLVLVVRVANFTSGLH